MSDPNEPQYDPETCITAAELREAGISVDASIPDPAWVPRRSIRFDEVTASASDDGRTLSASIGMSATEPFRWITLTGTIPP